RARRQGRVLPPSGIEGTRCLGPTYLPVLPSEQGRSGERSSVGARRFLARVPGALYVSAIVTMRFLETPGTVRDCWQLRFELIPPGFRLGARCYARRFTS